MENRNDILGPDVAFERQVKQAVVLRERDAIKAILDQAERDYQQSQSTRVRSIFNRRVLSIAASVLLLAAAFFAIREMRQPSHQDVFASFYEPYLNSYLTTTRSEAVVNNIERRAMVNYDGGNYEEALAYFEKLPEINNDIRMFQAISHIELGKFDEAKVNLKHLIQTDGPLTRPAKWYLGLVLLKEGQVEQAKMFIEELANQPADSSYQRDAIYLLKRI